MPNKINLDLTEVAPEIRDQLSVMSSGQKGEISVGFMVDSIDDQSFMASVESVSDIMASEAAPDTGDVGDVEEMAGGAPEVGELPPPSLVVIAGKEPDA